MDNVLKIKERKRRRSEDKAGSKNKKKKRKSKEKKNATAKETDNNEEATDDDKEVTDNKEESTDNKDDTNNVNEDEFVEITPEYRRKIMNEQMDIIEQEDKFAPMDDGSDSYDTEDEIEEHVCQQPMNDKRSEDMTLAKSTAY